MENIDNVEDVDRIGICLTRREDISCAVQIHFGLTLDYEDPLKPIDTDVGEEPMNLDDNDGDEDAPVDDVDLEDADSRIEHPLLCQTQDEADATPQVTFDSPAYLPKSVSETDLDELINGGHVFRMDQYGVHIEDESFLLPMQQDVNSHMSSIAEDNYELPCEVCEPEPNAVLTAVALYKTIPEYSASAPATLPHSVEMGSDFLGSMNIEVRADLGIHRDEDANITDADGSEPECRELPDDYDIMSKDGEDDAPLQGAKDELSTIAEEIANEENYSQEDASGVIDTIMPADYDGPIMPLDMSLHIRLIRMRGGLTEVVHLILRSRGLPSDQLFETDEFDPTASKYEAFIDDARIIGKDLLAIPGITDAIKTALATHHCITAEMLLGHYLVRCKNQRKFVTWFVQVTDDKLAATIAFGCLHDWCKKYI